MPWYEYRCNDCGHELTAEQRISEAPLLACPQCGVDALERLISNTSFALRGGGWYADGYGQGKPPSKASTTDSSKKDTKSESPKSRR